MEGIAALLGAIARGLRRLFDLASMAIGVAPTMVPLADAACLPTAILEADCNFGQKHQNFDELELSRPTRESLGLWDAEIISLNK